MAVATEAAWLFVAIEHDRRRPGLAHLPHPHYRNAALCTSDLRYGVPWDGTTGRRCERCVRSAMTPLERRMAEERARWREAADAHG